MHIRQWMLAVCAAGVLCTGVASAETAAGPQQNRMASCNKDATGKKGDERKAFMSACLSGKPAPAAAPSAPAMPDRSKMTPQERMKACNQDATGKKGDERKAFMSQCLKKS